MTQPSHREPPLARLVGRRPNRGAADAAKAVVGDVQQLLRAEIALAKAEVTEGVKSKVLGAGFFIVAGVVGWLAIQVFLVFLGFLFALFLPGWAAVGLVLLLLLIAIGLLGYFGMRKLKAEASLRRSKASIEESKRVAAQAVDHAKSNAREGVAEAKATLADTAQDVKARVTGGSSRPGLGSGMPADDGATVPSGPRALPPAAPTPPSAPQIPATQPHGDHVHEESSS